jgi:hypothetical protein
MVKIEMAVEISREYPTGKSRELIWLIGQSWPVTPDDDVKIMRLEAFGAELETEIGPRFSGGASIKGDKSERVLCRTWYGNEARYVSEQMRMFYP